MIRELVRKRLRKMNMPARDIAQELGYDPGNLNSFLNGKRTLPFEVLERLLIRLDLLKE